MNSMIVEVARFDRICVCGSREDSHAPWCGSCMQFRASGKVEETHGTEYQKQLIPNELRWEIWDRDNFTCAVCGSRRNLTIDHIVPERRGGTLNPSNLQTLCKSCNSRKGNR